jgi:hypothetical protein
MCKKLLLMICVSCFSLSVFAQSGKNWEVSLNYAYQFDVNEFNESVINDKQDLHQYGITIKRFLINKQGVQLLGGLGYSRQQILGYIGVNTYYGTNFNGSALARRKNYAIQLAEIPVEIRFPINDKFDFDLSVTPQFRFHQNTDYDLQAKFLFALNSVEIYPAISYKFNDFRFSLGGRLMNWQMPDKLFYYRGAFLDDNPDFYERTLYRYNPLKLRFTVSYLF